MLVGQFRAVLCGYYGQGNGGDEALLATLLQMLPESVTPLVLSGNPDQTREQYGVAACDRKSAFAVFSALRQSDALIWGGGSLMQDATSALSPFYYGGLMGLAQRMGLKTIAWAQGIGPLQRPLTRWLAQRSFASCTAVSVRDRASAALLASWQIPCHLAPDPVWALAASPQTSINQPPSTSIAITLRLHSLLTPKRLYTLTQAIVELQNATQTHILFIPFQPAQDLPLAQTIQGQLSGTSQILCPKTPQDLKTVFKGVEMAIGMRLHSLILAAAAGCRCFALSYDPKINQLMNELEMPGWDLQATSDYTPLPNDSRTIAQTWMHHYTEGKPLPDLKIQSLLDRALIHQELLRETFFPESQIQIKT